MEARDLRESLIQSLERLNQAVPEQRKAEDDVRRLKAEVATLNVKLAAAEGTAEGKVSAADFGHLVEVALAGW